MFLRMKIPLLDALSLPPAAKFASNHWEIQSHMVKQAAMAMATVLDSNRISPALTCY